MSLMSHQNPLDVREFIPCPLISMQLGLVFDAVPANPAGGPVGWLEGK